MRRKYASLVEVIHQVRDMTADRLGPVLASIDVGIEMVGAEKPRSPLEAERQRIVIMRMRELESDLYDLKKKLNALGTEDERKLWGRKR